MTDLKMPDPTGDFQKDFDLFVDAAVAAAEAKVYKRGHLEAAEMAEEEARQWRDRLGAGPGFRMRADALSNFAIRLRARAEDTR